MAAGWLGHPLAAQDRRVVEAFAAQATIVLCQERLEEAAATAGSLAEIDRVRTALLNAVSDDLRTPPSQEGTPGGGLTITISLPAAAEPNRHADSVEPHRQRASSTASRAATASERP